MASAICGNTPSTCPTEHSCPDADPDKPDIYVRYDWMGYGALENACVVDSHRTRKT